MNGPEQKQTIRLGDRVAYSATFIRSQEPLAGRMLRAQGEVKAFVNFGKATLAEIRWNTAGLPRRVNVAHLCLAASRTLHAA